MIQRKPKQIFSNSLSSQSDHHGRQPALCEESAPRPVELLQSWVREDPECKCWHFQRFQRFLTMMATHLLIVCVFSKFTFSISPSTSSTNIIAIHLHFISTELIMTNFVIASSLLFKSSSFKPSSNHLHFLNLHSTNHSRSSSTVTTWASRRSPYSPLASRTSSAIRPRPSC